MLCRILTDSTQPMNSKVKLAWLECMAELIPLLDSKQLHDTTEGRQALQRLALLTSEPKSGDIHRSSQKLLYGCLSGTQPSSPYCSATSRRAES